MIWSGEWNDSGTSHQRGCQEPPEVGTGKEGFSPPGSRGSMALMTPWVWTCSFQNWETIKFPLSVFMAALGN